MSHSLSVHQPLILAILNLTPDSFSDGLPYATTQDFLNKAHELIADGADVLDIGGESTRPGASPVRVQEEIARIVPFLCEFRKKHPDFPISIDTKKYEVALAALPYGVQIINDVSFAADPRLVVLARDHDCHYVLMHSRGDSRTMQSLVGYGDDVVATVMDEMRQKLNFVLDELKFPRERLILDPGFGFAKTPQQNVVLMEQLARWREFDLPLLFAVSRKRFLQEYVGECEPAARDEISAKLAVKAVATGFYIIRVHNVVCHRHVGLMKK